MSEIEREGQIAENANCSPERVSRLEDLTRPIIGIENRTAQEVFDIMADRIRSALNQGADDGR